MVSQDIKDLIDYLCSENNITRLHISYYKSISSVAYMGSRQKILGINNELFNAYSERQQYAIILHEFAHYIDVQKRGYSHHDNHFGIIERILYREFGLKRDKDKKTGRYRYARIQNISYIKE